MPFGEVPRISMDPVDPLPASLRAAGWRPSDAHVGATLAAGTFAGTRRRRCMFSEIRHVGGAVAKATGRASTMGNRDGQFLLHMVGIPSGATAGAGVAAHQRSIKVALGDHLSGRSYINFLDGDERRRCARTAIDAADLAAIRRLRAELDPDDVLRFGIDHDA